jgi:hypothetical protein
MNMLGQGAQDLMQKLGMNGQTAVQISLEADKALNGLGAAYNAALLPATQPRPAAIFTPQQAASIREVMVKLLFVAALESAQKKALGSKSFNVETAINDLWTRLDPVKKLAENQKQAQAELAKLQAVMTEYGKMIEGMQRAVTTMQAGLGSGFR